MGLKFRYDAWFAVLAEFVLAVLATSMNIRSWWDLKRTGSSRFAVGISRVVWWSSRRLDVAGLHLVRRRSCAVSIALSTVLRVASCVPTEGVSSDFSVGRGTSSQLSFESEIPSNRICCRYCILHEGF